MPRIPKIAVLVESSRAAGRGFLRGISKYARLYGPWTFYRLPPVYKGGSARQSELFTVFRGKNRRATSSAPVRDIEGIIAHVANDGAANRLVPKGCPAVIVPANEMITSYPALVSDGDKSGALVADYFQNLGLPHFGFCGYETNYWSRERRQVFQAAIEAAGHTLHVYEQKEHQPHGFWEDELNEIVIWLKSLPTPIGIWVWNDDFAQHVVEACKVAELVIPDEICIVGVDNDDMVCEMSDPPLSSLSLNFVRAGFEMAELLHTMMKGQAVTHSQVTLHATHIATRQSTNTLAIRDKDVAQALRFIYANAAIPIQVDDVVNAVTLSRRVLYERFEKAIGRSVYEEIMRVRSERIARLLLETNLPISRIAFNLGFQNPDHVSRYFKKTYGVSPREYRRRFGHR